MGRLCCDIEYEEGYREGFADAKAEAADVLKATEADFTATEAERDAPQQVYTDDTGRVWHPHRGYWCWKISADLTAARADHLMVTELYNAAVSDYAAARAEIGRLREAMAPLVEAADGLSNGHDWNNGTHALLRGYRQKLLNAVPAALRALGEQGK